MNLLTPGPVKVLDEIMQAQVHEMITHRSREFSELYRDLVERLKAYYQSEEAYILTGSGALGCEALVSNLCLPNEKMLCLTNGEFGERFVETAEVYTKVDTHKLEDGKGWDISKAKDIIDDSNARVFGIVYNETGYGVRNNIQDICKHAKKKGMITIIDGISAWPGTPFNHKEFYVDGFVTGSQKSIGAPPGMALLGLSKDAVERYLARQKIPNKYCDFNRHKKHYEKNQQTPNTPAVTLFWALQKAFDILDERGGLKEAVRRHRDAGEHVRKRLAEAGFGLIAEKGFESHTVTAFKADNPGVIREKLEKDYSIKIVGCKGAFKESGLRIAHMGNFDIKDIDACLDALAFIRRTKNC